MKRKTKHAKQRQDFLGNRRKIPEMLVFWFLPTAKPSGPRTVRVVVVVVVGRGEQFDDQLLDL